MKPPTVQFNHSAMSNSLQPYGLQHTRLPCPSPTSRGCSNSCQSSWWCHPITLSSIIPFSSCLQSFWASGSFQINHFFFFFASGDQSIGVPASTSVIPMNTQDWFPLGWTGWISLQFKGPSRIFSNTSVQKHQHFSTQLIMIQLWHPYMTTGKTIALTTQTFVGKVVCFLICCLDWL